MMDTPEKNLPEEPRIIPVDSLSAIPLFPPIKIGALKRILDQYPEEAYVSQGDDYDSLKVSWTVPEPLED